MRGKLALQVCTRHDHVVDQVAVEELQHVRTTSFDVQRLVLHFAFLEQQPKPANDFASRLVLVHDVLEARADLVQVRRSPARNVAPPARC